jgi:hypothetical protein
MSMFRPDPRPNPPRPPRPRPNPPMPPMPMPEDDSRGLPSRGGPSPSGSGDGRMTAGPRMPLRQRLSAGPQMPRRKEDKERPTSRILQQFPNAQLLPYIQGPVPDVIPPGLRPDNYSEYESFQRLPFKPGDDYMELFNQANNKARLQALINAMGGMSIKDMETYF